MSKCDIFRKESLAKAFEGDISNGRTHTFLCVRFQKSECAITLIYQSSYYIYISLYLQYHSIYHITLVYHSTLLYIYHCIYYITPKYLYNITIYYTTFIYHPLYYNTLNYHSYVSLSLLIIKQNRK